MAPPRKKVAPSAHELMVPLSLPHVRTNCKWPTAWGISEHCCWGHLGQLCQFSIPLSYNPAVLFLMSLMLLPVNFQDCRQSNAKTVERVPVVIRSLDQASATYLQHHCAPMQCMASEHKSEPGSLCDPPFDQNWGCPCCGHTPQPIRI